MSTKKPTKHHKMWPFLCLCQIALNSNHQLTMSNTWKALSLRRVHPSKPSLIFIQAPQRKMPKVTFWLIPIPSYFLCRRCNLYGKLSHGNFTLEEMNSITHFKYQLTKEKTFPNFTTPPTWLGHTRTLSPCSKPTTLSTSSHLGSTRCPTDGAKMFSLKLRGWKIL